MIEKILSRNSLLAERACLRTAGKTLVFTTAYSICFMWATWRYLAAARALGDALVVAIN